MALLAPQVTNEGTIAAPNGSVVMAAGSQMTLDFVGDGLLRYRVDQGTIDALVKNGGLIKVDGGQAILTAKAADLISRAVVNQTGVIEAISLTSQGGRIVLQGD